MTGSDKVNILLFIIVFLTSCSKLNSLFKKKISSRILFPYENIYNTVTHQVIISRIRQKEKLYTRTGNEMGLIKCSIIISS